MSLLLGRQLLTSCKRYPYYARYQICGLQRTSFRSQHQTFRSRWLQHRHGPHHSLYVLTACVGLIGVGLALKTQTQCDSSERSGKDYSKGLSHAVEKSRNLIQQIKDEMGCPGVTVAVFIDGCEVWSEGFGYSDVENRLLCHPDTVMRIASVSKPITMTMVAKLLENDKLDLDKPVSDYVAQWPNKTYKGQEVSITTRQLVSHVGGVRHYSRDCSKKFARTSAAANNGKSTEKTTTDGKQPNNISEQKSEMEMKEYYIKNKFTSTAAALNLFKDDELCSIPGTEYLYTTYGWTLISAVLEAASDKKFPIMCRELFKDLGLHHTYLDENDPIIYNRARYYTRNKNGRLVNAPYVDCSYKYAGGGLLSTVRDMCKYANSMLYSYQFTNSNGNDNTPGYLKPETVRMLWTPTDKTVCDWDAQHGYYAMGWGVVPAKHVCGGGVERVFTVSHTGGAIGASSALVVIPASVAGGKMPRGIVIALLTNMQSVGLYKTALGIADLFEQAAI